MPEPSPIAREGRAAFATQLRAVRLDRGLTQEAVAHAAGLDRSFYVEVETGKHSIALDRVFDLAEALQVSAKQLVPDVPVGTPAED
ncbi:helix-turn-helix domain-containing protein [Ornithinimicrobium faecis]|uniref:Helix-turn-helix domain-containing protein n=1 Tax=Ornithinimicrobium faecis TaxID=2934158 RepID=A0ABY4YVB8_9MICO|nr:helix-turn-helix transcriptional regulator [Ornithinimicrobium sp. HY1793]USQ80112.1 helix-turn-helix domain-containing protein [Ornithinimicrobium sp. HY1793]